MKRTKLAPYSQYPSASEVNIDSFNVRVVLVKKLFLVVLEPGNEQDDRPKVRASLPGAPVEKPNIESSCIWDKVTNDCA